MITTTFGDVPFGATILLRTKDRMYLGQKMIAAGLRAWLLWPTREQREGCESWEGFVLADTAVVEVV